MHMAATFLVEFISSIDTHYRSQLNLFSLIVQFISIKWERIVECSSIQCRQFQQIVIMRESIDAHLHLIGSLIAIFNHQAKYN